MDANEKYDYWLDIAQYDLDTAQSLLSSKRWLYVVFMCQQAIEKLIKGLYVCYVDDNIPRIHNVRALIERFEDKLPEPISKDKKLLFMDLSSYYLNNRYPEYMTKLSASIGETEARGVLQKTKEVFAWLLTLKP
jgi:HEPN domain-containing protein